MGKPIIKKEKTGKCDAESKSFKTGTTGTDEPGGSSEATSSGEASSSAVVLSRSKSNNQNSRRNHRQSRSRTSSDRPSSREQKRFEEYPIERIISHSKRRGHVTFKVTFEDLELRPTTVSAERAAQDKQPLRRYLRQLEIHRHRTFISILRTEPILVAIFERDNDQP